MWQSPLPTQHTTNKEMNIDVLSRFKTTIPAIKWPQTYALDHVATRNSTLFLIPYDINEFTDITT